MHFYPSPRFHGKVNLPSRPAEDQDWSSYSEVVKWYESMLQIALRSSQGPWVDAGCGHGYVTEFLRRNGASAIGVDIDHNQLKSRLAGDLCVIADVKSLPFKDDSINGVIAFEVLEHLRRPLKAMAEFHRVLKRGGSLLITTPTPRSATATHRGHVCVKPRGAWISVLRKLGFRVKVINYRHRFRLGFRLPRVATRLFEYVLMLYKRWFSISSTKLQCIKSIDVE